MKLLADMPVLAFLIVATALEVSGDALIRKSLFEHAGLAPQRFSAALISFTSAAPLAPCSAAHESQ